jgi:hypothetical protein
MFDRVADLEFEVTRVAAGQIERETPRFTRVSTEFSLHGPDATGRGEDVTYDAPDHDDVPTDLGLEGTYTLAEFSEALDDVDLFVDAPEQPASRHYRRWAVESAALDLALRRADRSLAAVLDRDPEPVRFAVSPSLGPEPSIEPVERLRSIHPETEFKLDPTPAWDADLIDALAATDAVRVLDLKGYYEGTEVDNPADPDLYERVLAAFPDAVVEDPGFTDETRDVLEPAADRLSFDYPVTSVESIDALPVDPDWLNIKPSRFGTVESLFETIEYCEQEGITMYGGGQFELGVGRGQIQVLASLWYPRGPNDVAPGGYNDPEPSDDLPASPLDIDPGPGFGTH